MATDTSKITTAANDLGDGLAKGGAAAKTLGQEIVNAIASLDSRVTAIETGGGGGTTPPSSMTDAVNQNTKGKSEAFPLGVPHTYNWYTGKNGATGSTPPSNFTAMTGWGQIYPEEGQAVIAGNCLLQNFQSWALLKTGVWVLVQDQAAVGLGGAHYVADFSAGGSNVQWKQTNNSDGSVTVDAPQSGYNDHYWPSKRGTYATGSVAGVFIMADCKVASSNMRFVVNIGADWWLDANAQFVQLPDGSMPNNPGVGMCNWIKLTTSWRRSYFYSISDQQLQANPPPPLK